MNTLAPDNFDWVSAKNNCNVGNMLQKLKVQARDNVEKRNAQLLPGVANFAVEEHGGESFTVYQKVKGGESIDFTIEGETITVKKRRDGASLFKVILTIDKTGACRCAIDGELLEPWQVLMKALEPLFFRA
jgi:hypothetical protein